jgi:DNA invertase Pin-like site-specific DNA recombinase
MKAIYIRTSTEEQNPENQLDDCKSLFEGEFELYKDKQSAWKEEKERPDFTRLRDDIRKGKIKRLYVWDLDRVYRNRKNLKSFFEYCKLYGCRIYSYRQKFLSELQDVKLPEGFDFIRDIMINNFIEFLGWIAEDESDKKSQRIKASIRNTPKGKFSYKGNRWGKKSISKKVIDDILKLREQGKTMREISKEVFYWDKNNHKKFVSIGLVHKILDVHKSSIENTNKIKSQEINS